MKEIRNRDRLLEQMSTLKTNDLITIVSFRSEDYEPEAIQAAWEVLSKRDDSTDKEHIEAAKNKEDTRGKTYQKQVREHRNAALQGAFFVITILVGLVFVTLGIELLRNPELTASTEVSVLTIALGFLSFFVSYLTIRYKERRVALKTERTAAYERVKLS